MKEGKEVRLPPPVSKGSVSLEEAISGRRSIRNFADRDLGLEQVGQLLWSAQGVTAKKGAFTFRAAPSAGAIYPLEVYVVSEDGLFRYLPAGHALEILGENDLRFDLAKAALGQAFVAQAGVDIVVCAVYAQVTAKYGSRGIRYVDIEAGHAAQNIFLQAVALGLGSVPVGAFDDAAVKKLLCLPAGCEPVYIISVGYPE